MLKIQEPVVFNWDLHNIHKSWNKHQVDYRECEQAFTNPPYLIFEDVKHSQTESRYTLFGKSDKERFLYITFTLRNTQIRIISARDMNKKERSKYETIK